MDRNWNETLANINMTQTLAFFVLSPSSTVAEKNQAHKSASGVKHVKL